MGDRTEPAPWSGDADPALDLHDISVEAGGIVWNILRRALSNEVIIPGDVLHVDFGVKLMAQDPSSRSGLF